MSVFITMLSAFGLGTFIAALNIKYRDFRYIIPFLIQSLFFLTPVIYPVTIIQVPWAQKLIALNPMVGAISILRSGLPGHQVNLSLVFISMCSAICLFIFGLYYFRKTEYYFADLA